jgi:hypothetical protein
MLAVGLAAIGVIRDVKPSLSIGRHVNAEHDAPVMSKQLHAALAPALSPAIQKNRERRPR